MVLVLRHLTGTLHFLNTATLFSISKEIIINIEGDWNTNLVPAGMVLKQFVRPTCQLKMMIVHLSSSRSVHDQERSEP